MIQANLSRGSTLRPIRYRRFSQKWAWDPMQNEFSPEEFDQLDVLPVQFADDPGVPLALVIQVILKQCGDLMAKMLNA